MTVCIVIKHDKTKNSNSVTGSQWLSDWNRAAEPPRSLAVPRSPAAPDAALRCRHCWSRSAGGSENGPSSGGTPKPRVCCWRCSSLTRIKHRDHIEILCVYNKYANIYIYIIYAYRISTYSCFWCSTLFCDSYPKDIQKISIRYTDILSNMIPTYKGNCGKGRDTYKFKLAMWQLQDS